MFFPGRSVLIDFRNMQLRIFILLSIIQLSASCTVLRSAKGLEQGQVQVNYAAPLYAGLRAGITDHVEARGYLVGETNGWDLFLHSRNEKWNYGLSGGLIYDAEKGGPRWHSSLILSRSLNQHFTPYLGYTYGDIGKKYVSLGLETTVFKPSTPFNVVIIPEINIYSSDISGDFTPYKYFTGTILIGFNIDFKRIFRPKENFINKKKGFLYY